MAETDKSPQAGPGPDRSDSSEKQAVATVVDSGQLDAKASELAQNIIQSKNPDDMDRFVSMFELNQAKKNALRILTLNTLLDKVNDQAVERFNKHPDEVTNKELLDYMDVVQNSIDRAEASLKNANSPSSGITSLHNEVNINMGTGMDEDSRSRVIDAVTALLANMGGDDDKGKAKPEKTLDMTASGTADLKGNEIDGTAEREGSSPAGKPEGSAGGDEEVVRGTKEP